MRPQKNCEITVFLSIVFILLVSFVFGILEITVIRTSANMSRIEADRAVFSVFGEYQKKLIDDYHVFALDGSYGTGKFEEDNVTGRMHYYGGNAEYEVSQIQFLTDNSGQSFREQVLEYMEQRYGVGIVREFTGMTAAWKEENISGEEIKSEENRLMEIYRDIQNKADMKTEENNDPDIPDEENPLFCLEQIEKKGVLSIVLPEQMELSGKQADYEDQITVRKVKTGRGSFPSRQGMNGVEERLLFNEYILQNFDSASMNEQDGSGSEEKRERPLSYEIEYILSGHNTDKENLESVLTKLFFIRMALNYTSLLGDSGRQSQAMVVASVISVIMLMPEAAEILKQLVLAAWAAGESAVDLRTLLLGKRVPVVKNPENWVLPLSGLLTIGRSSGQTVGEDTPGGMSYKDYLRTFLFLEESEQVTMRTLERIEKNIRAEYNMDGFHADQCITKIAIKSTAVLFGEITYQFPVYFGYE